MKENELLLSLEGLEEKPWSSRPLNDATLALSKENLQELNDLQRQFALNSIRLARARRLHKKAESDAAQELINGESRKYNKVYGEMARVTAKIDSQEREVERLQQNLKLPKFVFSREALKQFEPQEFFDKIMDENGNLPQSVLADELFRFELDSSPDIEKFRALLKIEYRVRIEKRVRNEILQVIRNQLIINNRKWTNRVEKLDGFLTKELPAVIKEMEDIRKKEYDEIDQKELELKSEDEMDIDNDGDKIEAENEEDKIQKAEKEFNEYRDESKDASNEPKEEAKDGPEDELDGEHNE